MLLIGDDKIMKFKIKKILLDYRKYIIIGILILSGIFLLIVNILKNNLEETDDKNIENLDTLVKNDQDVVDEITIDIKGAVKKPGVYVMFNDDRVIDAIERAGGLLDNADNSVINLSKKLVDEMVIIIYTNDEIKQMLEGNTAIKVIEKECVCPKLENDACIDNKITNNNQDNKVNFPISINKASKEELMNLPGIGESKANAIIKYRDEQGLFTVIEDIINVSGIGESVFEKIKEYIVL